jgi:homoserine kinase type II
MAVYTDITDEELGTLLADFDIGAPLSLKGVAEGVENSNFLLETEAGRFILTIYEKRVRAGDLPYFLDLLTWLSQHGFPGAEPVADRQGRTLKSVRGKPAAIVTFLPGLSVRRPNAAHCREAGAGLAWLHPDPGEHPGARGLASRLRAPGGRRRGSQARTGPDDPRRPGRPRRRLAGRSPLRSDPCRLLPR